MAGGLGCAWAQLLLGRAAVPAEVAGSRKPVAMAAVGFFGLNFVLAPAIGQVGSDWFFFQLTHWELGPEPVPSFPHL